MMTDIKLTHASCLQILLSNRKILGIYRSPSKKDVENFIAYLSSYRASIKTLSDAVITGDINIILKPSEQRYERQNRIF